MDLGENGIEPPACQFGIDNDFDFVALELFNGIFGHERS